MVTVVPASLGGQNSTKKLLKPLSKTGRSAVENLVDAVELAKILNIKREQVWRLVREKRVPYIDCGRGSMRFKVGEVLEKLYRENNGNGSNGKS